ncbi:glycine/D-amino acid oxidase-like deaminating enzyme [Christiangramia gaetbulicola]|uniref:Glycine/D-amino acid oxidase-like deaminating enzyme n=1 Tax=Christiangramia gaetbulicola TaxID=703340 RepID=A0A2T6ACS9_9FLAO|nr:FAD-dependent oxidoreductase [Christiangramia gaetbulicola]PTX41621.1 glycine/D-amino acid oxidase-like deaminating enzyme [Christiangramia gaetbulicola]
MFDYIIVGLGLSGLAVAEELEKRGKKFIVFEDNSQSSSYVAGGIFNPVILKRFTPAWNAAEQMKTALPFYEELEQKLHIKFIHNWNIYRRFHSAEEQNDWFLALDKPRLAPFLDPELKRNDNPNIIADYSFGKVLQTGNIDTGNLLDSYRQYLKDSDRLKVERFDYSKLDKQDDYFNYDGVKTKKIIFCEGFGLKKNPYFNYLPLRGNKGEYITIYSEDLKLDFAVKSSVFLMPMGNNLYKAGATYDHEDKTPETTSKAREKLVKDLKALIRCDFDVVDQEAGIRPAVADRKPLVGPHPEIDNIYCCNGFGSRGVLIAPNMSKALLDYIEGSAELDPEIDLNRFTKKHYVSN